MRAPNLITAVTDSWAGYLFGGGGLADGTALTALALASMGLYAGGVGINDVLDAARDAAQRPGRPIPSGRLSRRTAALLCLGLLALGVAAAFIAQRAAGICAAALAGVILLYDGPLKRTPLAPPAMGLCRALNLAMGMCAASGGLPADGGLPIFAMGLYVTSLTFFARREAGRSSRMALALSAAGIVGAALLLALMLGPSTRHVDVFVLSLALAAFLGQRLWPAIRDPSPSRVQKGVKTAILSLIALDAIIAYAAGGPYAGGLILSLLVPAWLLARIFYTT